MNTDLRVRHTRAQRGQAIVIGAVGMLSLVAMAGLSIDAGHDYLVRRQAQNAVDVAALGAGKQLAGNTATLTSPPHSGDRSIQVAHDFLSLNGFPTIYSTACESASASSYSTTWFDSSGYGCGSTTGFLTKVQINVPAVVVNGLPVPATCTGINQFACFQVTITQRSDAYFGGVYGAKRVYFTVQSVVYTTPQNLGFTVPTIQAVYLYEPKTGCPAGNQCFNEAAPPSHGQLTCSASNCPTYWDRQGAEAGFSGADGAGTTPVAGDVPSLESNGDMVVDDDTTFCDPYNGGTCNNGQGNAVGSAGFAVATGAKLYCGDSVDGSASASGFKVGSANGNTPCTITGPGTDQTDQILGNEAPFQTPSWTPPPAPSGLVNCGALILNGDTVANSFANSTGGAIAAPNSACDASTDPYQVQPGIYSYIVVNHGTYEFNAGFYDVTGNAPVNTRTGSSYNNTGANGIDHSQEANSSGSSDQDWDLCNTQTATGCSGLTAGVWIGHGAGWSGALSNGTNGACTGGISGTYSGTGGGGGDPTVISGGGVTFRLESSAGGFVVTSEVQTIQLSSPGVGSESDVNGAPLLIDEENNNFIHLDGNTSGSSISQYSGLIYQTQAATGGGVEIDPGLAGNPVGQGNEVGAVSGQIWAYSLTTFGSNGTAVDFTDDYSDISQPSVSGAAGGRKETSIVSGTTLTGAVDGSGNPVAGMETLKINYTDEWALDAYNAYVKVNSSKPVFFSSGIWNPTPSVGASVPPASNNPGDSNPAYPNPNSVPAGYTAQYDPVTKKNTDWTVSIPNGGPTNSTFEISGNWTWGHEHDISGANSGSDKSTLKYTFPTPAGSNASITIFVTDGDRCGDYYLISASFSNVGPVGSGSQTSGTVAIAR